MSFFVVFFLSCHLSRHRSLTRIGRLLLIFVVCDAVQVLTNKRGEKARRHWIVFDGDVDPDWAENLNSVLDDNKILTLPSGERLEVPDNVRIMLEVGVSLSSKSSTTSTNVSHEAIDSNMYTLLVPGRFRAWSVCGHSVAVHTRNVGAEETRITTV